MKILLDNWVNVKDSSLNPPESVLFESKERTRQLRACPAGEQGAEKGGLV